MSEHLVAILMGTYNGASHLPEQLASFAAQTHQNWALWASDDGSSDNTLPLLADFKAHQKQHVEIVHGPRQGFCRNFLSLLGNRAIEADYYCFSDQDDIWHKQKLERALAWLKTQPAEHPALYCSRTHLIDDNGQSLGLSPLFVRPASFNNALIQNIGGGNTMVMNHAARQFLLQHALEKTVVCHDWWVYLVLSGINANIHYDPVPSLDYRQHQGNLIGSNQGLKARLARVRMVANGDFRQWSEQHMEAIRPVEPFMQHENREVLRHFRHARDSQHVALRLLALGKARLYRQTLPGTISLWVAATLKRL